MALKHLVGVLPLITCFPFSLAAPGPKVTILKERALPTPIPTVSVRSYETSLPHLSYSGIPTVTGALSYSLVGTGVRSPPPGPEATTYPSDGGLHEPQPAPYVPAGGLGTNGTTPVYNAKSDFDYESLVCPGRHYPAWVGLSHHVYS
jgi:hypothetical protein